MAMQRRLNVKFSDVFPAGAYVVGDVTPVADYDVPTPKDQPRPQKRDKETGQPVWSVPVLDADPEAGKNEKTVNVKILATHQPVPPENPNPGLPFVPVEFVELVAVPWIEQSGDFSKLQWSLTAMEMIAPRPASKPASGGTGSKAAA